MGRREFFIYVNKSSKFNKLNRFIHNYSKFKDKNISICCKATTIKDINFITKILNVEEKISLPKNTQGIMVIADNDFKYSSMPNGTDVICISDLVYSFKYNSLFKDEPLVFKNQIHQTPQGLDLPTAIDYEENSSYEFLSSVEDGNSKLIKKENAMKENNNQEQKSDRNVFENPINDHLTDCTPSNSDSVEKSNMVATNIGNVPIEDYREIVANQNGFDNYDEMYREGLRIGNGYDQEQKSDRNVFENEQVYEFEEELEL
ncbi:MAG: hypothetical protein ACI39F_07450 [Acutalibacteraceae bacterium]